MPESTAFSLRNSFLGILLPVFNRSADSLWPQMIPLPGWRHGWGPCLALSPSPVCSSIVGKYAMGPFLMIVSSLASTICLWQIGVRTRLAVTSNSTVTIPIQCTDYASPTPSHTHSCCNGGLSAPGGELGGCNCAHSQLRQHGTSRRVRLYGTLSFHSPSKWLLLSLDFWFILWVNILALWYEMGTLFSPYAKLVFAGGLWNIKHSRIFVLLSSTELWSQHFLKEFRDLMG